MIEKHNPENNNTFRSPEPHIRISPDKKPRVEEWKELWEYRELIGMLVRREFTVKYKQTILGPMWILFRPFLTSLAYLFIFKGIAHIQTDGIPGILFYVGSNALWTFFVSTLLANANTFRDNANLFGKVYFPRLSVPVANMMISGILFLIEMLLFAVFYIWFLIGGSVRGSWIMLPLMPLLLLQLGILGLGCGIILSSATTKYRDVSFLVQFLGQVWMYVTPVLYPLSGTPGGLVRTLMLLNPVTQPMELFRIALFGQGTFVPWSLIWSAAVTVFVLFAGSRVFSRVEKTFIDTI